MKVRAGRQGMRRGGPRRRGGGVGAETGGRSGGGARVRPSGVTTCTRSQAAPAAGGDLPLTITSGER